ncbi:DUF429 domain-containing protein [soil metagenome]
MTRFAGLDGCKGGWVGVALNRGRFDGAAVAASAAAVVEALGGTELDVIGIDIPIGLPALEASSYRECDLAARTVLRGRASSVFFAPPLEIVSAGTYAEANRRARSRWGKGISAQAYYLGEKILEVRGTLADDGALESLADRVSEVHPELSFAAMSGGDGDAEPLALNKRSYGGVLARQGLLDREGIALSIDTADPVSKVQVDDVLDAAAAAWSAARIAADEHVTLGPRGGPTIRF